MAKTLKLATDLSLPLTAVTETFGILAARGAGKSNLAAVLAEQMFDAGLPFVVVDPVGSWFGLRAGADGQKDGGLPIPIFGGHHGDVPLERGGGELLADLVVSKRLSCVLDLSAFESESAKKQFLLAFAQRLYLKNTDPLHLFLEEADDYIPQRPMRDEAQLLRAWENIVRRGRSRGLGMTLITQRSASISKSVLTQVQTLFVLRTTGPQDRAAIEAWVKYHDTDDKVLSSLSGLASGEGWAWSPQFLGRMSKHKFHRRRTFDSGATPKNLRGKDARAAATLADVDLSHLTQQMAATVERAKADDPKELKKQLAAALAENTKLLNLSKSSNRSGCLTKTKDVPVLTDADRELLKALSEGYKDAVDAICGRADIMLVSIADRAKAAIDEALASWVKDVDRRRADFFGQADKVRVQRILDKLERVQGGNKITPQNTSVEFRKTLNVSIDSKNNPSKTGGAGASKNFGPTRGVSGVERPAGQHLPPGEKSVLTAAAQFNGGVSKDQLGVLTGYKKSSRDAYIARLIQKGLAIFTGGRLLCTDAGIDALGSDFEPLPTGDALLAWWRERLPEGERKVLDVLVAAYPASVGRATIDEATGYKKSSRDAYLSRLTARRLVITTGPGIVSASVELFS